MSVNYPPDFNKDRHQVSVEEETALRRALWLKRAVVALCAAVVVLCAATAAVTSVVIRMSQVDNSDVLEQTKRGTTRIEDCTTPGRDCYERGQSQLKDTVAGLNRYGVFVAACASGPYVRSDDEITRCVVDKLRGPAN